MFSKNQFSNSFSSEEGTVKFLDLAISIMVFDLSPPSRCSCKAENSFM